MRGKASDLGLGPSPTDASFLRDDEIGRAMEAGPQVGHRHLIRVAHRVSSVGAVGAIGTPERRRRLRLPACACG